MGDNESRRKQENVVELKRRLGLIPASCLNISNTIGSGIFITPTSVLNYMGSTAMALTVWGICGVLNLFGCLCYANLATLIPRSGSDYAYLMETYGHTHKFWGRLPGFLYAFITVIITTPVAISVIMLTSAEYIMELIVYFICMEDEINMNYVKKLIALSELALITYINCTSVKLFVRVQGMFTFLKIMACFIVIVGGIYQFCTGDFGSLHSGFQDTTTSPKSIALAFYSGIYAFGGSTSVTLVTQEIKNPQVNIWRSILISAILVTAIYFLMNLSYMAVLSKSEILSSDAVAMTFGEKLLGYWVFLITFGVAFSTFGTALTIQYGISRICYAAGEDENFPRCASYIHVRRMTPVPAVLLVGVVAFIVVCVGDIISLIQFSSFINAWSVILCMVALIILRSKNTNEEKSFQVPLWIPIVSIIQNIYLFVVPIAINPEVKYGVALSFLFAGFLVYCGLVYKKIGFKLMDYLTYFIQVFFEVIPSEETKLQ